MRIPTQSAFERTKADWLQHFDFVHNGMRQAECSAYAMKVRFAFISRRMFGVSHDVESAPLP